MINSLLLSALALASQHAGAADAQRVYEQLIQDGRFVQAVRAAEDCGPGLAQFRARVESRYYCGDLTGAFGASLEALKAHPNDPLLLHLGSDLALQLLQVEQGTLWSARLNEVALTDPALSPEQREFYLAQASTHRQEAQRRGEVAASVKTAILRARWTLALMGLLVGGLLMLVMGQRRGPRLQGIRP